MIAFEERLIVRHREIAPARARRQDRRQLVALGWSAATSGGGQPENPMICPCDVWNIFRSGVPHVATGAVGIFRVMRYARIAGWLWHAKTFCPEERRPLLVELA